MGGDYAGSLLGGTGYGTSTINLWKVTHNVQDKDYLLPGLQNEVGEAEFRG